MADDQDYDNDSCIIYKIGEGFRATAETTF